MMVVVIGNCLIMEILGWTLPDFLRVNKEVDIVFDIPKRLAQKPAHQDDSHSCKDRAQICLFRRRERLWAFPA